MEIDDQDQSMQKVEVCFKSEPNDTDNYQNAEIKLEDIMDSSEKVHIKSEIDKIMLNTEVDLMEFDDFKPDLVECSEFGYEGELGNDSFTENFVDDNDLCYAQNLHSNGSSKDSKWEEFGSSKNVIKLSYDETARLLKLYASERVLYDSNHKEYHNKVARVSAIERISDALQIPGLGPVEIIQGLRKMRWRYSRELRRIADKKKAGETYKPNVFWFEQVNSFIRPFAKKKAAQSNEVLSENRSKQSKTLPTKSESYKANRMVQCEEDVNKKAETPIPIVKQKIHSTSPKASSSKISEKFDVRNTAQGKSDCYDHFGSYIAELLRSVKPVDAMVLQQKITSSLIRATCPPTDIAGTSK